MRIFDSSIRHNRFRTSCHALAVAAVFACTPAAQAADAVLFDGKHVATIVHEAEKPLALAGDMLAGDMDRLSGIRPRLTANLDECGRLCVVIGRQGSPLVDAVVADTGIDITPLKGGWERYGRALLPSRSQPNRRYLLIAGSDMRGAIWGTVDLGRDMGVSAWEWWADVTPRRADRIAIDGKLRFSAAPSTQYRGIFLNDEDWGLQPWAAKTFEPEVGDIGPKSYGRIFQLMWRLKANLIWPAMHDSTKPFYQIEGNAQMARDHAIVVGTSHAEPLMRNNVREWDDAKRGDFNFFTNRDAMVDYWRERVEEVRPFENIYSVGLRGKHDSEMEGAASPAIARDALAQAIDIQRGLLATAQARPATQIPQALTLYKEVLDLYSLGLKVPDDVTLVWPEDNYGYISQLSTPQEQARGGGAGVYYHISYWGRPHDYLWLATTHPALIREQMDRAWQTGARKIWMLNVGDIKPAEYLTQYSLDLAFDHRQLETAPAAHLDRWAQSLFGEQAGHQIAAIMTDYYDLAFERRPEFMGFNQVEPVRPVAISDYVRSGGKEAQRRLDRYDDLVRRANALAASIPPDRQDAYFQLVLYPVRSAANINERTLKLDLAALRGRQGRPVANLLAAEAKVAHARIVADTDRYNSQREGKWRGMMNMAPRDLPVFQTPAFPQFDVAAKPGCAIDDTELDFVEGRPARHALTIFSKGTPLSWRLTGQAGLTADGTDGQLNAANGFQHRLWLDYDGRRSIASGAIECGGRALPFKPRLARASKEGVAEIDHVLSIAADRPLAASEDWERIEGLGSRQASMRARLQLPSRTAAGDAKPLTYAFETSALSDASLHVIALPVHPLTSRNGSRLAVQLDDGPVDILDFETHGRSDEWKRNVLGNSARRVIAIPQLAAGRHRIHVYAMEPGFILDRLDIRLDGAAESYGAPPLL